MADAREQLDSTLGVTMWRIVPGRTRTPAAEIEPGAPAWWHGDDEASAPFVAWARSQGWTGEPA